MRLIAAEESKLARKREIKAADLKGQQIFLTLRQTRTPFYEALLAACRKEGFEPDLYTDVIQLPFIMNIVATGQGISFIPNFFERIKPEGTHFRKYNFLPASACIMPLSIGYRAHDPSPLVQNFVNIARKASNP